MGSVDILKSFFVAVHRNIAVLVLNVLLVIVMVAVVVAVAVAVADDTDEKANAVLIPAGQPVDVADSAP